LQKPLAVAAAGRLAEFPQVPTLTEAGVPNYELRIWTGVLAPAGTPAAVVSTLSEAVEAIVGSADVKKEIAEEGGEARTMTPRTFGAYIRSERRHWSALVHESGVPKVADGILGREGPISTPGLAGSPSGR
jgi:tripartite-type tricarboxylate transporter receptor subunit TctC